MPSPEKVFHHCNNMSSSLVYQYFKWLAKEKKFLKEVLKKQNKQGLCIKFGTMDKEDKIFYP